MIDKCYNVVDKYRGWTKELIVADHKKHTFPFAVLMQQLESDFNIGTVVRTANAFAAKEVYYIGKKQWDRRGAVGTHHYTDIIHRRTYDDLLELKEKYVFVGLENTPDAVSMPEFQWPENTLMILGEESSGITAPLLAMCDHVVSIPQFGTVRSLNAGTASAIAMYDYINKRAR